MLIYSGSPVDWTDGDFNENVTIRVSDHSEIDSLTIRAHYDPLYGDPFTVSQPPQLLSERIEGTQHVSTYNQSLDQHGWFDEPPEYYYVTATDVHGTQTRTLALERANFYGNLAGALNYPNAGNVTLIHRSVAAHELGRISGFTASWGSTVRGAKQGAEGTYEAYQELRENPVEYLQGLTRIIEILERYGLLDTLVNAFVGPLQERQAANNPYDQEANPELYTAYKVGW